MCMVNQTNTDPRINMTTIGNGSELPKGGKVDRREIDLADWQAEGTEKFGDDMHYWRFKCPMCKETQSFREFVDARVEKPDGKLYFSCIGRWVKGRGCDCTLGGLFRIHETEVIDPDGVHLPVMEFADVETKD